MNDKKIKVGINGFGRIGRVAARIILQRPKLSLAAINSRADISSHAYLLKHDTSYQALDADVKVEDNNHLMVNKNEIRIFNSDSPENIPWKEAGVDIVIDSTGKFRTSDELMKHIKSGAKYVVLSAPAKDATKTLVMGVNHKKFDQNSDFVVSNSSCTTNCLATTLKVLEDNFQVVRGIMNTIHAVTDSQNLLDNSHKKEVRLRRAAFASMIPASTGSAKDISKLYPGLTDKIHCRAIRIPLLTVSMVILSVILNKTATKEEINNAYKKAALTDLKNILSVADEELVSNDYKGTSYSSIVDPYLTRSEERRVGKEC